MLSVGLSIMLHHLYLNYPFRLKDAAAGRATNLSGRVEKAQHPGQFGALDVESGAAAHEQNPAGSSSAAV